MPITTRQSIISRVVTSMQNIHDMQLQPLVTRALEEDWGDGDWPTDICIPKDTHTYAQIIAQESLVVACLELVTAVFSAVDSELKVELRVSNGTAVNTGAVLVVLSGRARSMLKGERVALNFLAHLCGIATLTAQFVAKIADHKAQLLDTRDTTPCLRLLEKTAAASGGARNHRLGLCDGVVIKENHIRAAGGIKPALALLQESLPPTLKVEVEVERLDQLQEALAAGADLIVLDNLSCAEIALAVRLVQGRVLLEAAGNITLANVEKIAATGVDFISSGAIIHSSRWSDVGLVCGNTPAQA